MRLLNRVAAVFCATVSSLVFADHTAPAGSVALVGSLQSELGCPGDWQPDCAATELTFTGSHWLATFDLPAGSYEYKVALNDSWDENYGADGAGNGANIPLVLTEPLAVTFRYDPVTHIVSDDAPLAQPAAVTIAGDLQSELGCPGDWQPDCAATGLTFDAADGVWQQVFTVPAGDWFYKAPLNLGWDLNYGANGEQNGPNIALSLAGASDVKFYYSHATNWVTDDVNSVIATLPGNFQSELGCPGDWQPDCLRSWLQDVDGDGIYTFATRDIPAGDYEVKVAYDESWAENYGAGGAQNGPNIGFSVPEDGALVVFSFDPATKLLDIGGELPAGDIGEARAYWLDRNTIAWNVPADATVSLHYSADAGLALTSDGVVGGEVVELTRDGVVDGANAEKFRHLAGLPTWRLDIDERRLHGVVIKAQLAVAATADDGRAIDATALQIAGVLDDLYANDAVLGPHWRGDAPSLAVWAPTARSVRVFLYDSADPAAAHVLTRPMSLENATGVWYIDGDESWDRMYYEYEVEVFTRATGQVERNRVTDPYSVSLSMNSQRSQIVNLDDDDLKPRGWDRLRKPRLAAPEDIVLYELHVRDFSIGDERVPEAKRGTFAAFTERQSSGARHLRRLARSGLTHVHLLPAFDCASVPEDRANHATPGDLTGYAPDSDAQQAAIDAIRDADGFNWCYDPWHYTTPEGSYSTDPNGVARIREFREMVAALSKSGLRTVMDVVYNHTSGSLQGPTSVLDKIVPDYYHRLNDAGYIEMSSCCANTATEHAMMEKLMLDSLKTWATAYKVDGFRFDLMGHHTRANIERARDMLASLTPRDDGVDGRSIYLYGEGWNFGEVANDARFEQATQINMGDGTGVGSFNDRIRDAVRGGGPFDSGFDHVVRQGFMNGLYTDPNRANSGSAAERDELLRLSDWLRVGLAGSIGRYTFEDRFGNLVRADQVDYPGQGGAGYTSDPQESINYAAAHDNETLFDINQYKLPLDSTPAERLRAQNLGNSLILLGQGIPFLHAGQELMRSKSMDRNSYNSGDWFNVLDYTLTDNGYGRGLPPEADNAGNWSVVGPMLADPRLYIGRSQMRAANRYLRELLRIRKSSPLLRLRTGDDIVDRLEFHNTGPGQVAGLVAMSLRGDDGEIEMVVLFNAAPDEVAYTLDVGVDDFELHPVQQASSDPVVRRAQFDGEAMQFTVPGRTAAVFVSDD